MDAHTHRYSPQPHIYVLSPDDLLLEHVRSPYFCAGIHPWSVDRPLRDKVSSWAQRPGCVGIGETGLDRLTPQWNKQLELFEWHWNLAEEFDKPLVLHLVRSASDLLFLLKRRQPKTAWLWHDFTGPAQLIKSVLRFQPQCFFSCGPRAVRRPDFDALWGALPKELRLLETDDSGVPIEDVYRSAKVLPDELRPNFQQLFSSFRG